MYTDELAAAARKGFDTLWADMAMNNVKSIEAIHGIQQGLSCCGRDSPQDWLGGLPPLNAIPSSCCEGRTTPCSITNAFPTGCSTKLFDVVNSSGMLIAWIAVVFGAFEVRI